MLHYGNVPNRDRAWAGPAPITSPRRTLVDCAKDQVSPDLLRQAAQQALRRGLVTKPDLHDVEVALEPFGGLDHADQAKRRAQAVRAKGKSVPRFAVRRVQGRVRSLGKLDRDIVDAVREVRRDRAR